MKENQGALHADVEEFFADPTLAGACKEHRDADAGHGRIEERSARVADAGWLAERHPQWKGLRSIAAITCLRTDKKTGAASKETRFYISSLPPDPERLLAASRAHWSVENNLHWTLDVTFGEDECRTRKDYSAINLAMIRHAALNILKRDAAKIPIKRKRVVRNCRVRGGARAARSKSSMVRRSTLSSPTGWTCPLGGGRPVRAASASRSTPAPTFSNTSTGAGG